MNEGREVAETLPADQPIIIGISLKMYFSHARTLTWTRAIADIAAKHPAVQSGAVELFVVPTFPALVPVKRLLAGLPVRLGAQDVAAADVGAYTGEVSAGELVEVGCSLVEIGHAERRNLFHEDDTVIATKTAAALRNGLTPLLCVGEKTEAPPALASHEVITQVDSALAAADEAGLSGPIVVAYEPVWAIGAASPAPSSHIASVVAVIERHLAENPARAKSRVIYGGSAGPGLLTELEGKVSGLFLGRFAHEPAAVETIIDEASTLRAGTAAKGARALTGRKDS